MRLCRFFRRVSGHTVIFSNFHETSNILLEISFSLVEVPTLLNRLGFFFFAWEGIGTRDVMRRTPEHTWQNGQPPIRL